MKEEEMQNSKRRAMLQTLAGLGLISTGGLTSVVRAAPIKPGADSALIVVDVQNCFRPGGTLPVNKGDEVVPIITAWPRSFENVVITQDWHTPGHASFASSHPGKKAIRDHQAFRMAPRCCGRTTVSREAATLPCIRISTSRMRNL